MTNLSTDREKNVRRANETARIFIIGRRRRRPPVVLYTYCCIES
jgi:hypothetical protein